MDEMEARATANMERWAAEENKAAMDALEAIDPHSAAVVKNLVAAMLEKHPKKENVRYYATGSNDFVDWAEYHESMKEGNTWCRKAGGWGYRPLRANEMLDRGQSL